MDERGHVNQSRSMSLRSKSFQEAKANFKPMNRGKEMKRSRLNSRYSNKPSQEVKPQKRLRAGKQTKAWAAVRAWLKPRFEKRGITRCEFGFILHDCWKGNGLSFAHSHKRNDPHFQMYAVALACPPAHQILDERFSHDQMAIAVHRAIEARGGIIKP